LTYQENKQFGEISIMNTLNKEKLIKHINDVIVNYKTRRDAHDPVEELQAVADYNISIIPLRNLQIRIIRGDFDESADEKPVPELTVEEKSGVEPDEN